MFGMYNERNIANIRKFAGYDNVSADGLCGTPVRFRRLCGAGV
jgi:hypothetical protein